MQVSKGLTGVIFAAALLSAATGARAEQAEFDFVLRGISAGALTWSGDGAPGAAYSVKGRLKTAGLAALLKKVRYDATASGTITAKGTYLPRAYAEDADTGKRKSQSTLRYSKGVPALTSTNTNRKPRAYDVDPATQGGTVDPLTAMFTTLREVAAGQECRVDLKMFDGHRASRLVTSAAKATGDKVVCSGEYRRVAGFSPEDMAEKTRFPFTLTYAPAGEGRMRVVEVAMDTLYGKARLVRR